MKDLLSQCTFCEREHAQVPSRIVPDENYRAILANAIWKVIATDITKVSWREVKWCVLTAICEFSRYLFAKVVQSEQADDIWPALHDCFSRVGFPLYMRSDRGTAFVKLQPTFERYGMRGLLCTSERPTANGVVERVHRTMKDKVRSLELEGYQGNVHSVVASVVHAYNLTPHTSLDMQCPADVFFGREVRIWASRQRLRQPK